MELELHLLFSQKTSLSANRNFNLLVTEVWGKEHNIYFFLEKNRCPLPRTSLMLETFSNKKRQGTAILLVSPNKENDNLLEERRFRTGQIPLDGTYTTRFNDVQRILEIL